MQPSPSKQSKFLIQTDAQAPGPTVPATGCENTALPMREFSMAFAALAAKLPRL
jgi:hypothetical protein